MILSIFFARLLNFFFSIPLICSTMITSTANMVWRRRAWRNTAAHTTNRTWCTITRNSRLTHRFVRRAPFMLRKVYSHILWHCSLRVTTATSPAPTQRRHHFWTGENFFVPLLSSFASCRISDSPIVHVLRMTDKAIPVMPYEIIDN